MNILSIESSCDETAAAVVKDGGEILSNVVVSQIDIFKAYGGVIPEVAARSHLEAILPVVHKALDDAFPKLPEPEQWKNIDAISATHTPGLLGSLLIGTLTARTLAILHDKPFYPIHHLKSHIYSCWLKTYTNSNKNVADLHEAKNLKKKNVANICPSDFSPARNETYIPDAPDRFARRAVLPACQCMTSSSESGSEEDILATFFLAKDSRPEPTFPLLALVVSGGHTQIIRMKKHNDFKIIGTTRDDAVGECFDKVAKILGLPYPGGPSISAAALGKITLMSGKSQKTSPGDRHKYQFPHPKLTPSTPNAPCLDFSFSGLKTAVLRSIQKELGVPISFPSHDLPQKIQEQKDPVRFIADFAASFEQTAIDILLENLKKALTLYPDTTSIVIAGGVSANTLLRKEAIKTFSRKNAFGVFFPPKNLSGDNAAMVASATFYEIESGVSPSDPYSLTLLPRSPIS